MNLRDRAVQYVHHNGAEVEFGFDEQGNILLEWKMGENSKVQGLRVIPKEYPSKIESYEKDKF